MEERIDGPTPAGGDHAVAVYFDDDGDQCAKDEATHVAITEYGRDGERLREHFAELRGGDAEDTRESAGASDAPPRTETTKRA